MECKYIVAENVYRNGDDTIKSYGVAVGNESDGETIILTSISDISSDIKQIERLVDICNRLRLDPVHIQEVVSDFLANV